MPSKSNVLACSCIVLLMLLGNSVFAQKTVTGRVISNADKQPIASATVQVKGSKVGVQTAADGTFSVTSPKDIGTLVISVVGFETVQVPVGGKTSLGDIGLATSATSLNDIVVTGYTTQKKKDITGAVTVVDTKALKAVPGASPDQLLQGQAAGVQVLATGQPGAASQINIRGITSLGNNNPLYIIDGVQADFHDINPNDVESIQVLKDAGSAAIYGVQGSNGVIVITTKKGRSGRATISYDATAGVQEPIGGNPLHLLNTPQYLEMSKRLGTNTTLYSAPNWVLPDYVFSDQVSGSRGIGNQGDPAVDPSKYNFTADHSADYLIFKVNKQGTDWFHETFKQAFQQNHTVTVSGGGDKGTYLFSVNYTDQNGTLLNTYLKRYSVRLNTTTTVKNHIRIGENAYVFYKNNPLFANLWENSAIQHVYYSQPIIPVYDIGGNYAGSWDGPNMGNGDNPVADVKRFGRDNKTNQWDILGNMFAEVDFLKHFTIRTSFGGTIDNQYSTSFSPTPYEQFESHNLANTFTEKSEYNSTWLWTNTLQYKNVFAEKHSVSVLVGTEAKDGYGRHVEGTRNDFSATLSNDPNYWVLTNGTDNQVNSSYATQNYSLYSLFGRLDYAFADKYLFGATFRRDGASVLASNVRYGNFPSVSVGWRISGEEFMKDVVWINELKLRASWGKLGSVLNVPGANAYNAYGQSTQSSYYSINGSSNSSVPGYLQTQIGNAGTTWEKDKLENIGLDAVLFKNKVTFTAEYFIKSIDGLLILGNPPAVVGYAPPPFLNAGNMQNKGFELSAAYHGTVNNDLHYNIGLNFTSYKNKMITIPGTKYVDLAASRQGNLVRLREGQPVGAFYGYEVERLFRDSADVANSPTQADAAAGRFKFRDISGPNGKPDGVIDAYDKTTIGNPNPKFTYGINLGVTYKNWEISTFLYGSYGNQIYNETRYWTDFYGSFAGNKSLDLLNNSWTPTNLNAKTPVLESNGSASTNNSASSYFVEPGSFLKMRYLKVAYSLTPSVLKSTGIDRLTLYVQATNLFQITKYTGIDPEIQGPGSANGALPNNYVSGAFGIDYGNYPNNQRGYLVGINLSF
ncbi:MAG TPA: TonB-dependent receptor [Puia sp.]|nr:TonB-dependent receptor [Puia sp.]